MAATPSSAIAFAALGVVAIVSAATAYGAERRLDPPAAFNSCAGCHSIQKDINGVGPSLFGVVGRKAGTLASFPNFTTAMKNSNVTWTEANLLSFMADFANFIPNTNMKGVPSVASSADRTAIADFLKTLTQPVEAQGDGKLVFENNVPCYYRNYLFGKNIRASYWLEDESVAPPKLLEGPFLIDGSMKYGRDGNGHGFSDRPPAPGLVAKVQCGGTQFAIPLDDTGVDTTQDLVMPNAAPKINKVIAELKSKPIKAAPKGSTVLLRVVAEDFDGDGLQFFWRVTAGKLSSDTGRTVRWTLPKTGGLHFAYVLANDKRGGHRESNVTVSTDAGTVTTKPPPAQQINSGIMLGNDQFLTFFSSGNLDTYRNKGMDSRLGSCRYYVGIGAAKGCTKAGIATGTISFSEWLKKWQFAAKPGPKALYANHADLNLQRDMHGKQTPSGAAAFYTCNHPNVGDRDLKNAINHKNLVACVSMEYSKTTGVAGGRNFTKFLTFGPTGQLIQSVNLDSRGEKFMPGSCVVCHGASRQSEFVLGGGRFSESAGMSPDLGAVFLPFDPDNFVFSRLKGFRFSDQKTEIFKLNQIVRKIDASLSTLGSPGTQGGAVVDLIDGWYPSKKVTPANFAFVPPGWAGQEELYSTVVKPSCRTCHVAMTTNFETFDQFKAQAANIANFVCGNRIGRDETLYTMPNARVTWVNFWTDPKQVSEMLKFLKANGFPDATCARP